MTKKLFFLAFFWGFLIPASIVHAQTTTPPPTTPAPTITSVPLIDINTPTPRAYPTFESCPESGIINGWGTVTPSAYWSFICGDCLITPYPSATPTDTLTPAPVPTYNGTGTPPATVTPTLETTPTTTPAGAIGTELYCSMTSNTANFPCTDLGGDAVEWDLTGNGSGQVGFDFGWHYHGFPAIYWQIDISGHSQTGWNQGGYVSFKAASDSQYEEIYRYDLGGPCPSGGACSYTYTLAGEGYYSNNRVWHVDLKNDFGDYHYNEFDSGHLRIAAHGFPTPAPTVTPGPGDSGFCGSVEPVTPDNEIFGLTGLELGNIVCVDLLPIDIKILTLEISVPRFAHICFQDVSFGYAYVFGMKINLTAPLYLLAIAWSIRNLFIS